MSNQELLKRIDYSLGIFGEALLDLKLEQEKLSARIAFIAPTDSDIAREVESFITKSLAA